MSIERYFITLSYALITISFVMLSATGQVDWLTIALFSGVLITACLIDNGILRWSLPRRIANMIMLGYLALAVIEWQILDLFPVTIIVHFVLFASTLKLLRNKTNRDWLWLYIVSFCQVLMTAGMMIGTNFLLLLVVYLFVAISTFISYEIRRSQQIFEANQPTPKSESTKSVGFRVSDPVIDYWRETPDSRRKIASPRWRSISYFSAFALALILVLAVPIFLAMPRLNRGFSRNGLLSTETLTGFSDSVRLGDVAQVKLNPQIVMRVRVRYPNRMAWQPLRWRGVTLDFYDGHTWSMSGSAPTPIKRNVDNFRVDDRQSPLGLTQQQFFVEPLNINTVFAAPRPILLAGLSEVERDGGDGLWTEPHPFHKIDYRAYSDTSAPSEAELAADNSRVFPAELKQRYTQLPPDHDQRIGELTTEVTRGATTQIETVRRIEQHLRTGYGYSLNLQRVEDGDPVADFLFNVRSGHCEYFASAMVLMLRTKHIPARLVNGFQMGEYNNSADVYTVRQSDAHSWVEVYFPKNGWVMFDPTPPAGMSIYDDGLMSWLRHYSEAVEMFWLEHVVGFDTSKQLTMALSVQRWLSSYQRGASLRWMEWANDLSQQVELWKGIKFEFSGDIFRRNHSDSSARLLSHPITLILFGLLILTGVAYVWRAHNNSWRRISKQDASTSAVLFYREMLRTLERAGHRRMPYQTPLEFAESVAHPGASEITRLYLKTRFGNLPLTDAEVLQIGITLKELRTLKKRNKRNAQS